MTAQEIIERLRAEIKIRLSANGAFDEEGDSAWHYDQGMIDAYNYILSFLSDLEKKEKPVPADLEEAAEEAATGLNLGSHLRFIEGFKAGAKWQAEQDQETIELAEDHAYLAGAVNEREKMMKEAVEGEYGYFSNASKTILPGEKLNLKEGDKVRIIIVKED